MANNQGLNSRQGKINPDMLMRHFALIGIMSIFTILMMTSYGIFRVYKKQVISNAEDSAVKLADALTEHEMEKCVVQVGYDVYGLKVTEATFARLDRSLRDFLEHFGIVKIKIYDLSGTIIFSTDRKVVGKRDAKNPQLAKALSGMNNSKLVSKEKVLDLHGEEIFHVDVVETYVPIRDVRGNIIGSFELYQDVTRYYREVSRFVITSAGIMFGILSWVFLFAFIPLKMEARQLKATEEDLERLAKTDPLTGISNRRHLFDRCEEEISRLKRLRERGASNCIGFIMVDIDHFKNINDTYGHAFGDKVIHELAGRLKACLRQHDIIGRYGGEEFLAVLPDADSEHLRTIAERLWGEVRTRPFEYEGENITITISLGVSSTRDRDESSEEIIKRADGALYRSKDEGRDRITYA